MKLPLSTRLIALFWIFGLGPFLFIGLYAQNQSADSLRDSIFAQLEFIQESKTERLTDYFSSIRAQTEILARDRNTLTALNDLSKGFFRVEQQSGKQYNNNLETNDQALRNRYQYQVENTLDASSDALKLWWPSDLTSRILQHDYIAANTHPIGSKQQLDSGSYNNDYDKAHARYHPFFRAYLEKFGYYDLFLVDAKAGRVVYSVFKEIDFATSLFSGPYSDANIGRVFIQALESKQKNSVHLIDFERYAPSYNASSAFIASPIHDNNDISGVIILQIPIEKINAIMTNSRQWEKVGLGKTGESFLIGPDYKFRSDARPMIQSPEAFSTALKAHGISDTAINRIKRHKTTIGNLTYRNEHITETFQGASDLEKIATDYLGNTVLLAHKPVNLLGMNWAMITSWQHQEAYAAVDHLRWALWVAGLICIVIISAVAWLIGRSISRPIKEAITVISSSSTEIAATINQQERISSQQATSVNETNTTMEELSTSARLSSEQSNSAASNSEKAIELAEHGSMRASEMLENMDGIQQRTDDIANQILQLSERTDQIRGITRMVTDFANETKMLAMNAAVEAVRAGEHGKGFSVLAVETRKLADESKKSAAQINSLIEEIQKTTHTTVMVTEEGTKTVAHGRALMDNMAETFHEVLEAVNNSGDNAQQISLNLQQQSVAVNQVGEAMKSLNTGAKETAIGMKEIKSGVHTLNETVQKLRKMV
ncbi:MAG: methyl-accepting chemotaxis protein [Magnetococcales bacterium]|nr:methyl-accepting chemotaxis protein [Magnetococcales bacterium]